MDFVIIKNKIRNAMISDLYCSLTIGREDEDLEPYNPNQLEQFIHEHRDELEKAVNAMFRAYEQDKELEELEHAEYDWYREFLYDYIELPQ